MRICSFTLPDDLADWAAATARAQDRSASSLVRQALLAMVPEFPPGAAGAPQPGALRTPAPETAGQSGTACVADTIGMETTRAAFFPKEARMLDTPTGTSRDALADTHARHMDAVQRHVTHESEKARGEQQGHVRAAQATTDYLRAMRNRTGESNE